jgi:hypothetical protein
MRGPDGRFLSSGQSSTRPHVRLWRIEHPDDGDGPFAVVDKSGFRRPHVRRSRDGDWVHPVNMPGPYDDRRLRIGEVPDWYRNDNMRFAYPTARELLRWWSGWALMEATRQGYVVRLLSVPWERHIRMRTQCIYHVPHATVLHTMAPSEVMWCAPGPVPKAPQAVELGEGVSMWAVSNYCYASW